MRRNLPDSVLEAEARQRALERQQARGKQKFLQKYYHKGAFFMDTSEDVYKRDYSAPTLEDRFDKTILPEVMQVKNFGRTGRTKWTHLAAEDTSKVQNMHWIVVCCRSTF